MLVLVVYTVSQKKQNQHTVVLVCTKYWHIFKILSQAHSWNTDSVQFLKIKLPTDSTTSADYARTHWGKNSVSIWRKYIQEYGDLVFWLTVYT